MEEWSFVGELELKGWKGPRICLTFHHFTYGVDASYEHCWAEQPAKAATAVAVPHQDLQALVTPLSRASGVGEAQIRGEPRHKKRRRPSLLRGV